MVALLLIVLGIGVHDPQDMVLGGVLGPLPIRQTRADRAAHLPIDVDDV